MTRQPKIDKMSSSEWRDVLLGIHPGLYRKRRLFKVIPWWDERVNEFETMYWCDRCLPRACKQILKQLAKNEKMLSRFVEFVSKRVGSRQFEAPHYSQGAEALEYARQVLDDLIAHEVFIRKG